MNLSSTDGRLDVLQVSLQTITNSLWLLTGNPGDSSLFHVIRFTAHPTLIPRVNMLINKMN